jgi:hypothetical protein
VLKWRMGIEMEKYANFVKAIFVTCKKQHGSCAKFFLAFSLKAITNELLQLDM